MSYCSAHNWKNPNCPICTRDDRMEAERDCWKASAARMESCLEAMQKDNANLARNNLAVQAERAAWEKERAELKELADTRWKQRNELLAERDQLAAIVESQKVLLRMRDKQSRRLWAVAEAAEKLLEVVGDGDNGPAPSFNTAWYALDEALSSLREGGEHE